MITWNTDLMDKNMVIKLNEIEKSKAYKNQGKGILDRAFGLVIKTP